jgi:signal peptidase I
LQDLRTESVPEPVATNPEESHPGFARMLLDVLETLVLSVLLFVGINAISARIRVDGYSMEPTLHTGEFVIVNRLAYQFGSAKIGDVIVFHYPRDPQQEYIKRIIGLGGDTVRVEGGNVYVNGQRLSEPYIAAPPAYQNTWQVPEGSLFVLGDNRNNSSDSHNWGFVPMNYVVGKSIAVYWPPEDWGLITHPDLLKATP